MMIMQKRYLNDYCEWLFDILFELEKRIDPQELSAFQGRFYGRVSEIIFNVWLDAEIKLGKLRKMRLKSCLTSIWKRLIGGKEYSVFKS